MFKYKRIKLQSILINKKSSFIEKRINSKSNQTLNKNIWKSFDYCKIISKKNLNKEQKRENDFIKKLSEQLIMENFSRNPTSHILIKTSTGYRLNKVCSIQNQHLCRWYILMK